MYLLEPPHRGGSNEYPQSLFLSRNIKKMYTPVHPSFTIQMWGLRGSKLYKYVFVMEMSNLFSGKNKKIVLQMSSAEINTQD